MALIRDARSAKRPPYSKRTYLASVWRGRLRVTGWPRTRNIHPTAYQAQQLKRLAEIMRTIKAMIPREVLPMRTAIENHNRQVRGQQGAAAVRYEDIQTTRLSGRLFAFERKDQPTVYPWTVFQDTSETLDWIHDAPGGLLVRGPRSWGAAIPCKTGRRFTIPTDPDAPENCPLQYRYLQDI